MNRVLISSQNIPVPKWGKCLGGFTRKVLVLLVRDKWDVSILLCDDETIKQLNSKYRGKSEATDVLTFVMGTIDNNGGRRLAGDIVISLDTLRENSGRFNISEDEELRRLLIHGILHLDGMDHKTNGETEPMLQLQEKILTNLKGESIMPKKRIPAGSKR